MRRFLMVLALVALAGAAQAATVYLKDGSAIKGTVVSATARDIQLYTPDGTLRISVDRISKIDYAGTEEPQAAPAPAPAPEPEAQPAPQPRRVYRYPPPQRVFRVEPEVTPFEDQQQEFSFDLGLNIPYGRISERSVGGGTSDVGDTGFLGGLTYLYRTSPRVAWGAGFEYAGRSAADTGSLFPGYVSSAYGDTLLLMGYFKYTLSNHGMVRPYIMPGIGAAYTSLFVDARPDFGFGWPDTATDETRRLIDQDRWTGAAQVKLGIDFYFNEPYFACLEVGWTGVPSATYAATADGENIGAASVSSGINSLTIAGRWGWRF